MDGAIALMASDVWQRDVDFPIRVPSDGLWESSDPAVLRGAPRPQPARLGCRNAGWRNGLRNPQLPPVR